MTQRDKDEFPEVFKRMPLLSRIMLTERMRMPSVLIFSHLTHRANREQKLDLETTLAELGGVCRRSRSTVQRSIRQLTELNLLETGQAAGRNLLVKLPHPDELEQRYTWEFHESRRAAGKHELVG